MEYFLFPKKSYYLSQGYGPNSFSHQNTIAIDVTGKGGNTKIYAPFTGFVAKIYKKEGQTYTCWLVSENKVVCGDGRLYYAVCMLSHPNDIDKLKVGQKFKQGDYILNDGDTGYSTGKHLEICTAIYNNKDDIEVNWFKNSGGSYSLINQSDPCNNMVLADDCKVINDIYQGKLYQIKKQSLIVLNVEEYTPGLYETLDTLRVRTGPGLKYPQKRVRELSDDGRKNATNNNLNALAFYKKGTLYDALEIIRNSTNDIWAKSYSGYINIINGEFTNSIKK